jgi:hypothetical protein
MRYAEALKKFSARAPFHPEDWGRVHSEDDRTRVHPGVIAQR